MIIKKCQGTDEDRIITRGHNNDNCFYCGKNIIIGDKKNYFILWNGYTGYIVLHPKCAETLAVHLIKDVRSCELNMLDSRI